MSGWNLEITPYLWVAGFRGDVGVTIGQKVLAVPLDVSFSELSENLKIGAMGSVRFRYRRFAILGEANYIAFGSQDTLSEITGARAAVESGRPSGALIYPMGSNHGPG